MSRILRGEGNPNRQRTSRFAREIPRLVVGDLITVDGSTGNHGCTDGAYGRYCGNGEVAVIEASSCSSCWQVGHCNQHVFARAGEVLKIDESQAEWNGSQWVAPLA